MQISAPTDGYLLSDGDWQAIGSRLELTGRELDIVRHLVDDQKESAIAYRLGISSHTVHAHLHRLYLKLGVRSRLEAVVLIFRDFLAQSCEQRRSLPR